ncbi:2-haloalkanoic acid dehalogenase [Grosmannia clavigera kw1407]|uniref:2-haloalkanoic acid dehalogenase n=1 Tax=Grosmannia clavigera (strain kw1407 / UAMH 11150) TaxID=655863 RepID=F0XTN1_GROCL|nr:2-haloalkanoic acid dehalogenase [Grosmannia clavigera kw1407]EFW98670.1 2-haloalkanoic acid dehalogenase [Grosmannia clavigera kw1407]
MALSGKHVVFDIVGTCVTYDAFYEAVDARIGDRLRVHGIRPRHFAFTWMMEAEREYSYLDRSGRYVPFWTVFPPLFFRVLFQCGIEDPRTLCTADDAAVCAAAYRTLRARPGILECHARLRAAGFTVWAFTSGDATRVQGYLAANGIDIPAAHFVTCDSLQVGKPTPEAYRHVLNQFAGATETWFAAAHMWDTMAAQCNGFKGAWCSVYEKEPVTEVFGTPLVMADSLVEMADKIIAAST